MNRNKYRVFVSLHFRQNITRTEQGRELGYARFHWSIWVQQKGSHGGGSAAAEVFETYEEDVYANVPGSGGWVYKQSTVDAQTSPTLVYRILVGKLPRGVGFSDVKQLLAQVPLPRPEAVPVENCVSWTEQAIALLQEKGWAEPFSIREFMDHALKTAADAVDDGIYPAKKGVENYTERQFKEAGAH